MDYIRILNDEVEVIDLADQGPSGPLRERCSMNYSIWGFSNRHDKFFFKHHGDICSVSRKTKKHILGKKMNRKQLKQRLASVVVNENKYPVSADISDCFCPRCGCEKTRGTGNMADYPEVWVRDYCLRCGFLVGTADNSPYIYALEFPENNYEID